MIELRYYLKNMNTKEDEYCRHCLLILTRKTQKTLARCPNCGEPYFDN